MVFSLYPEPQQKGRKKKICSQWQSWKWVANLSLACLSPGNTLANVCSPRALEAANTLTGSVNNEQTLYRISCHMMAPDMRLGYDLRETTCQKTGSIRSCFYGAPRMYFTPESGSDGGWKRKRIAFLQESDGAWMPPRVGIHTVLYPSGITSPPLSVSGGTHLLAKKTPDFTQKATPKISHHPQPQQNRQLWELPLPSSPSFFFLFSNCP